MLGTLKKNPSLRDDYADAHEAAAAARQVGAPARARRRARRPRRGEWAS